MEKCLVVSYKERPTFSEISPLLESCLIPDHLEVNYCQLALRLIFNFLLLKYYRLLSTGYEKHQKVNNIDLTIKLNDSKDKIINKNKSKSYNLQTIFSRKQSKEDTSSRKEKKNDQGYLEVAPTKSTVTDELKNFENNRKTLNSASDSYLPMQLSNSGENINQSSYIAPQSIDSFKKHKIEKNYYLNLQSN